MALTTMRLGYTALRSARRPALGQWFCRPLSSSGGGVLDMLHDRARKAARTIVLPESQDPRVIDAAAKLADAGICRPVLLAGKGAGKVDVPKGVELIDIAADARVGRFAEELCELQKKKGLTIEKATEMAAEPIIFGGMMVRCGDAHGAVAGSEAATADVLRAGLRTVGLTPGCKTLNSSFIMIMPDGKTYMFADCAVNPSPTSEQLADICVSTAESCQKLIGEAPKVGLLSFSTKGSAEHPDVDKVRAAGAALRERGVTFAFDDELQLDAAVVPKVGSKKAPNSSVAGECNVLVFPDLDAGNIGYKLAQRLGGAEAIGPIVQGLQRPYMDLSRGCSVDDIFHTAAVAACLAA